MRNNSLRDRILRYLFLGMQVEELLWYFGPCRELTEMVYQGKVRLQKEVERPLWHQGQQSEKLPAAMWQDFLLTLVPADELSVRDRCLELSSEANRRAIEDEQNLVYKSVVLIETDLVQTLHETVRKIHQLDHAIRLLYRSHPRLFLDTLQFYVVTQQEMTDEAAQFLQACQIALVQIDASAIPARFGGSATAVPSIPGDFQRRPS